MREIDCGIDGPIEAGTDWTGDGWQDLAVSYVDDRGYGVMVVEGPLRTLSQCSASASAIATSAEGSFLSGISYAAGDANDDGVPDLIVASGRYSSSDGYYTGAAFLCTGPLTVGGELEHATQVLYDDDTHIVKAGIILAEPTSERATIIGTSSDFGLFSFGSEAEGTLLLDDASAHWTAESLGGITEMVSEGDLDGDGVEDLVVTNHAYPPEDGGDDSGQVVVLSSASPEGLIEDFALASFTGPKTVSWAGRDAAVGDWTGDGYDDLAISLLNLDEYLNNGAVLVFAGPLDGDLGLDSAELTWEGSDDWWYFGDGIELTDDLTGDGNADLVGSQPNTDDGYGRVYVLAGPRTGVVTTDEADWTFQGNENYVGNGHRHYSPNFGSELTWTPVASEDGEPAAVIGTKETNQLFITYGLGAWKE